MHDPTEQLTYAAELLAGFLSFDHAELDSVLFELEATLAIRALVVG